MDALRNASFWYGFEMTSGLKKAMDGLHLLVEEKKLKGFIPIIQHVYQTWAMPLRFTKRRVLKEVLQTLRYEGLKNGLVKISQEHEQESWSGVMAYYTPPTPEEFEAK